MVDFWNWTTKDGVTFFNGILCIFTGALAIVSFTQIRFLIKTDKTARLTARAAIRAANAAKKSAEAAKLSINSLAIVERAYVYPIITNHGAIGQCIANSLVHYLGDPEKDDVSAPETTEITFTLKNYGKTPAVLKGVYAAVAVPPIGAQIGLPISEATLGSMETSGDLIVEMSVGLTRNQAKDILAYLTSLSFVGTIVFIDIWGDENTTYFLFTWDKEVQRMALREVDTEIEKKS